MRGSRTASRPSRWVLLGLVVAFTAPAGRAPAASPQDIAVAAPSAASVPAGTERVRPRTRRAPRVALSEEVLDGEPSLHKKRPERAGRRGQHGRAGSREGGLPPEPMLEAPADEKPRPAPVAIEAGAAKVPALPRPRVPAGPAGPSMAPHPGMPAGPLAPAPAPPAALGTPATPPVGAADALPPSASRSARPVKGRRRAPAPPPAKDTHAAPAPGPAAAPSATPTATQAAPAQGAVPGQPRASSISELRGRFGSPAALHAAPTTAAAPVPLRSAPTPAKQPLVPVLQVGSFGSEANAKRLELQLSREFGTVYVAPAQVNNRTMFRVRVGGFLAETEVVRAEARLRAQGHNPVRYNARTLSVAVTP